MGMFIVLSVVALVQWMVSEPLPADTALLVALYSVAVACEWIRVVVATLVLEIGVLLVKLTSTLPSVDLEQVDENADSRNSQVTGPRGLDLERVGGGIRDNPIREIGTTDLWLAAA
ncbi:MAG: hypothetical protein ABSH29_03485 [Acidimicrobiales bacterium]|jgi:hypothetical protein